MASSTITVGRLRRAPPAPPSPSVDRLDLEALPVRRNGERLDDVGLVLHDHDPAWHGAPPGPRRSRRSRRIGRAEPGPSVRARGPRARGVAGSRDGRRSGSRCRPPAPPRPRGWGSGSNTSMSRAMPSGRARATTRRVPPPERATTARKVREPRARCSGQTGHSSSRARGKRSSAPERASVRPAVSAVTSPARRPEGWRSAVRRNTSAPSPSAAPDQRVEIPAEPGGEDAELVRRPADRVGEAADERRPDVRGGGR